MNRARRPAGLLKMNNRSGVNEKKLFNISRERSNPNQLDKKERPPCFSLDHIYARQADSAERKPVHKEKDELAPPPVTRDKVPGAIASVRPITAKLYATYSPRSKSSDWRPVQQERTAEAIYQCPMVENKTPRAIADVKQGTSVIRRPVRLAKTLQLSTHCVVDSKAPGPGADTKNTTKKVITIYTPKKTESISEQLANAIELQKQCSPMDDNDFNTFKVKKLSEKLLAVYSRMKNSENKSNQLVPLEVAAQYIYPAGPAVQIPDGVGDIEQAAINVRQAANNVPHGVNNLPQIPSNVLQATNNVPQAPINVRQAANNVPQGANNVRQVANNAWPAPNNLSQALHNVQQAAINVPQAAHSVRQAAINVPQVAHNIRQVAINVPQAEHNVRQAALNVPPAVINVPPAAINVPPAAINVPQAVHNVRQAVINMPPPVLNVPPAVINVPPAAINVPPAAINEPPAAPARQPPPEVNNVPIRIGNEPELANQGAIANRPPGNNVDLVQQIPNNCMLRSQYKQLRQLLVYHLDLIQNLNESISTTTKLYQDLKEENNALKNVIKRKALPGSPHFTLSHTVSRHIVTTTITTASTSTSVPTTSRSHSSAEIVLPRDNASERKVFAPVKPELSRGSATGVPCPPRLSLTSPATAFTSASTSAVTSTVTSPPATVMMREHDEDRRGQRDEDSEQQRGEGPSTAPRTARGGDNAMAAQDQPTTTSGAKAGRFRSLSVSMKPRASRTFSAHKKPKMISTASKGGAVKKTTNFGSLSDRLQLIDTTPTGEDPYQLGEADMREQSPIPKLMLQKSSLSRRKACPETSTTAQKRTTIYDVPTSDTTLKSSLQSSRYGDRKFSNITDQPPKTLMTEDPDTDAADTESGSAWRMSDMPRSLSDFSYGESSSDLGANKPLVDFQNLFSKPVDSSTIAKATLTAEQKAATSPLQAAVPVQVSEPVPAQTPAPVQTPGPVPAQTPAPVQVLCAAPAQTPASTAAPEPTPASEQAQIAPPAPKRRRITNAFDALKQLDFRPKINSPDPPTKRRGRKPAASKSKSHLKPVTVPTGDPSLPVPLSEQPTKSTRLRPRHGNTTDSTPSTSQETERGASKDVTCLEGPRKRRVMPQVEEVPSTSRHPSLLTPTNDREFSTDVTCPETPKKKRVMPRMGRAQEVPSSTISSSSLLTPTNERGASRDVTSSEAPKKKRAMPRMGRAQAAPSTPRSPSSLSPTNQPETSGDVTCSEARKKRRVMPRMGRAQEVPSSTISPSSLLTTNERGASRDVTSSETPKKKRVMPRMGRAQAAPSTSRSPSSLSPRNEPGTSRDVTCMEAQKKRRVMPRMGKVQAAPLTSRSPSSLSPTNEPGTSKNVPCSEAQKKRKVIPRMGRAQAAPSKSRSPSSLSPTNEPGTSRDVTCMEVKKKRRVMPRMGRAQAALLTSTSPSSLSPINERGTSRDLTCSEPQKKRKVMPRMGRAQAAPTKSRSPSLLTSTNERGASRNVTCQEVPKKRKVTPRMGRAQAASSTSKDSSFLMTQKGNEGEALKSVLENAPKIGRGPGLLDRVGRMLKCDSEDDTTSRESSLEVVLAQRPRSRHASTAEEVPTDVSDADKCAPEGASALPSTSSQNHDLACDNASDLSAAVYYSAESGKMAQALPASPKKRRGRPPTASILDICDGSISTGDGVAPSAESDRGGRQRSHSATEQQAPAELAHSAHVRQQPPEAQEQARRDKTPVPCKMTFKRYHTELGDPDLPWTLSLDKEATAHAAHASNQSVIEVPRWREKQYASISSAESIEPIDDRERLKRHKKLEAEEKRQQRWYMRRLREERHTEHLRRRERARNGVPPEPAPPRALPASLLQPSPQDAHFIQITDRLPVVAFGEPMPDLPPKAFMPKWMKISKALKRLKRSRTLQ